MLRQNLSASYYQTGLKEHKYYIQYLLTQEFHEMISAFQYVRPTAQRPVGLTKESGTPFFGQTWPTDGKYASYQFLQMYLFPQSGGFINVLSRRATGLWVSTEDIKMCKNISDILGYRLMYMCIIFYSYHILTSVIYY